MTQVVTEQPTKKSRRKWWLSLLVLLLVVCVWLVWEMRRVFPNEPNVSFATQYKPPPLAETLKSKPRCAAFRKGQKRVFWGDLHVHTSYSVDAFLTGTRNDPVDAYAFARGKELLLADQKTKIKIERPLDFMAVTDHAEYFAAFSVCFHPKFRNLPICMGLRNLSRIHRYPRLLVIGVLGQRDMMSTGKPSQPLVCLHSGVDCHKSMINTWKHIQAAAQQSYQRCKFTTFVGYEWTATPGGSHMHRNVIFANAHVPEVAYDFINYATELSLWRALQKGCQTSKGCDVVTIPHNTNWSDGLALRTEGATPEELKLRRKYDRLVEIHQAKGNSECLNPFQDDKGDCNFEISINPMSAVLAKGGWWGLRRIPMTKKRWAKIRSSYVRSALKRGIQQYAKDKLNPLQLGFIGSTDTHNGTPGAVAAKGFSGSHGDLDVKLAHRLKRRAALATNPGGLAAVWAEENTRESIFAALKRRETYGTSGPRILLRFYQVQPNIDNPCVVTSSKAILTTMGGILSKPKTSEAKPRFVVQALMDKTRLARVDIVTATVKDGKIRERILRFPAKDKGQGDTSICRVWSDTLFDPKDTAYWYARVLEQPTPRWSKRDCEKAGTCKKIAKKYNRLVQQRAWSSPIWHHP